MSVQNVMVRDVVTVNAKAKVRLAWMNLMEKNISGAPVVDDEGTLIGIISMKDIYHSIIERCKKAKALHETTAPQMTDKAEIEKEETRELTIAMRAVMESTVSSLLPMSQTVMHLGPLDSLDRAIKLMAEHNINRLPIVKEGKVVGIVTRQDVIMVLSGRSRL
ncbi:MAG TPA: CBS domain-containing protein [Thermoplasmata archaeon]|nr:CBS domain-containing protein [Thermoplasmata archaeon]